MWDRMDLQVAVNRPSYSDLFDSTKGLSTAEENSETVLNRVIDARRRQ
ncbi:putative ATPase with chaperone activity [Heliobacterium gestii]|nr:putative ATPase with chaperone activity [Heliomicrobium gestii]